MAALPVILMVASTAVSAIGAISQGNAAAASNRYNAQVAEQNSVAAQQQAAASAAIQQEQSRKAIGASVAAYGASGFTTEGTPLDILANSASSAERDRQNILYKGQLQAAGYQSQAELDRASASNAEKQGYMSATGILVGGGAKAWDLSGGGSKPSDGYRYDNWGA